MSAPLSLSVPDVMASVVETLQFAGGKVPATEEGFWRELAAHLNLVAKSKNVGRVAQAVLDALGVEWDDDFEGEDGTFALALYETLEDAARQYQEAKESGEDVEEEDDDSLAGFQDERVAPVTWALETVYEHIRDGRLVLSPEWQRNFVWKSKKMKRFIESILLGLPIPSFLIFEDTTTGRKYVIDGRQRLETIARFKAGPEQKGAERLRFKTFPKKEPGWGPGEQLEDAAGKYYHQLDQRFKSRIDGTPLVVAEFRDIQPAYLYQVFKRYNTGAVALNAAEIRNAVYQASPLHKMLFRLAGEQRPTNHVDDGEKRVAADLRQTMQKKAQRYGAYDLIGRYFAFAYQERGSVANATVAFMDAYSEAEPTRIEAFRREFVRVFQAAASWYPGFLTLPDGERFHAFLATLQLVSANVMLTHIDDGRATVKDVGAIIAEVWPSFAANRLALKQNSTLFWGSQKTWISLLEVRLGLPRSYERWDWEEDLQSQPESSAT